MPDQKRVLRVLRQGDLDAIVAIDALAKHGSGVLLYLAQEGRGIGLVNKLRAYGLQDKGFPVLDLTDNELAKLHIRHMVGGHAAAVPDECVLRFEFPERPGALFNFLTKLGGRWNISMFHYRNHGAADGRVLAALQVPHEERHLIPAALDAIGYPYWDETDNPAYRLFLG